MINKRKNQDIKESIAKYKGDSKKLWHELKKYMNKKNVRDNEMMFDGQKIKNKQEIADEFYDFFVDSKNQISASISYDPFEARQVEQ